MMRSESSGYGGYAAPSSWVQPVPTVLTSPQGSPQARWEKVEKVERCREDGSENPSLFEDPTG